VALKGHPFCITVVCIGFSRLCFTRFRGNSTENQKPEPQTNRILAGETGDLLTILRGEIDEIYTETHCELMMFN